MASNISPGVYSKVIDLSQYVQAVPSTIGCIMALTKKGKDNQLSFVGSRAELISGWGEPNIQDYGKNYGQGLYEAYNFLGESGSLYFMRCLPDNAAFSNIRIDANLAPSDSTASIEVTYLESLNSINEIKTNLEDVGNKYPICFLYPIGRGEHYNSISVRFTEHSNPMINGIYVMDIYELQSDGDEVIVESFEVSFDPKAIDSSGDSIWIKYILETYSSVLRCAMEKANGEFTEGYNLIARVYDKNIGNVSCNLTTGNASITDNKQNFIDWQNATESGNATYMVIAKDAKGNKIYGWLGAGDSINDSINVFNQRNLTGASREWVGNTSSFSNSGAITYEIKKSNTPISSAFLSSIPIALKKGTDGSLVSSSGDLDTNEATDILSNAYAGLLVNPITSKEEDLITDTEFCYFSMVFDAGYPTEVKQQISTLVQTRRDCIAVLDNGDNSSFELAISARENVNVYNNYYTALYESYNKVYDLFTGQDIWVSPVYHMSYILPRNDSVSEIWYAAAGFNRAAIDVIKELRYNPKLGQRDQMYLHQLNPIVKFSNGFVVWSQLTSQSKASAMQDINIVRLVLYIKRALELACRFYIFEQNDAMTWSSVGNAVTTFLNEIKRKRGLDSFSVEVAATEYEKKTKTFHVNVTLNPTRTVEKIELNFFIQ